MTSLQCVEAFSLAQPGKEQNHEGYGPQSGQYLHSWGGAITPSILVLSLLELFKQVPLFVGAHSGWLISLISNEIYSHKCLFNFSLDPRLGSRLGPMSQLWEPWLRLRLHGRRHRHCYRRESFAGADGESGHECEGEVEECGEVARCRCRRHHVGF